MATLTIRRLDDALHESLRRRAAANGHSMEEEVRQMLADHLRREPESQPRTLHDLAVDFRRATGGVEPELPERRRESPRVDFSESG
jgi:plasmid stability protein